MGMHSLRVLSQAQGCDLIACMIPGEIPGSNVQNKLLLENVEVKSTGKERSILNTIFSDSAFAYNPR